MAKKPRKKREVFGPNFKWDEVSNEIAYYCFRLQKDIGSPNKLSVAKKLGTSLSSLNGRIQHFNSLTEESSDKSAKPSQEVKDIFNSHSFITDLECLNRLKVFLGGDFTHLPDEEEIEAEEDLEIVSVPNSSEIDQIYKNYWNLQTKYQKANLLDVKWEDFLKLTSTMNIKTRGIKIENRIIVKNKLYKSLRHEEGDAWLPGKNGEKTNVGIEIKTSFITPLKGSGISVSGLRLWEELVMWYLLVLVDLRGGEPRSHILWVPKEKLHQMDEAGKLTVINMKKSAAKNNSNIPKGLSLNDADIQLWSSNYSTPSWFKVD